MNGIFFKGQDRKVAQKRAKLLRDFLQEFARTPDEHWSHIKKDRRQSWEHSSAIKKAARAAA